MKNKTDYNFDGYIYKSTDIGFVRSYCDVDDAYFVLGNAVTDKDFKGNAKQVYLCNLPFSFDIEISSFENVSREKRATMYIWQFGINGYVIIGRTWKEFKALMDKIVRKLKLNVNKRVIIYVHNLSFEFQFIRKMFEWENVFSLEERRPLYALTKSGLEFRCSYLLSGYSLETVAKNLTIYKINKLVGDLDYKLIRHSRTALTDNEIMYCVNDVKIVMLYIKEYLTRVKTIHSIPLTKTGAVRKFCRQQCFFIKTVDNKTIRNYNYKRDIKEMQIRDLSEFNALQRAFAGGFTHANANYVGTTLIDVSSYDFTSSYPSVMICEKFPLSKAVKINVESDKQFKTLISKYCCVFDIEFFDIYARENFENYISVSKCMLKEKCVENNGRVVCAKHIVLTITEIDFAIIQRMYKYSRYRVGYMYVYNKGYLPTAFVKAILELYKKKTELKGVRGFENEYLNSKEMLNSCYGMCVTSPLRDVITYNSNNEWGKTQLNDIEKNNALLKYNLSDTRFLYYAWGVYVTAYARRNLFTAIYELKGDYVYSDTDSVKFLFHVKHKDYFDAYNAALTKKLRDAMLFHSLDYDLCQPRTIKGKQKLIGAWDYEGTYKKFKTLGAKRYIYEYENGEINITVSGVNKKKAVPYLLEKYGKENIFEAFDNYLYIPPHASGKNLLTYIDYETDGEITDYKGETAHYSELSSVNLSESEYNLSLAVQFINYLKGIREFKK